MPSKRVLITAGVLAVAAGATAIAAHSYRGHHDGWRDGGHGGWRGGGDISKSDFDAQTRARFAQADVNGDGVIDTDEAKAVVERRGQRWRRHRGGRWMQRRMERMLRRFDEDRDGKVTRTEFDSRVAFFFGRMDLDGDDKITDMDLPPMMRGRGILQGEHAGGGYGRRGPGRMMRMLRGADANKDGEITRAEATAAAAARFARFDRNRDGVVERADLEALRAEGVDYRAKRFLHRNGGARDGRLTLEQFKAERDRRFARWDANSDGVLSRNERLGRGWRRWAGRWHGEHGGGPHHGWGRGGERWEEHRGRRGGFEDREPPERSPEDQPGPRGERRL